MANALGDAGASFWLGLCASPEGNGWKKMGPWGGEFPPQMSGLEFPPCLPNAHGFSCRTIGIHQVKIQDPGDEFDGLGL